MSIFRTRCASETSRFGILLALSLALAPGAADATPCFCDESRMIRAWHPNPQALRHAESPPIAQTPGLTRRRPSNTDNPWETVPFNPDAFWDWINRTAP
jgi:hypothetical protein